jgi:mannose/fructose/N-acetylgalactosamine-specific phosphotransferase system component IIC
VDGLLAPIPWAIWVGWIGLGAFIAVEQVSFAQLQLAHPLIAGTLAGLLAGDPARGALAGALLGLLLAGHRPVGGVIPPDAGPAAVIAAAALAMDGRALVLALIAGVVAADLGRYTEAWTRRRNQDLLLRAEAAGTAGAVRSAIVAAVGLAALRGGFAVALALAGLHWALARMDMEMGAGPSPIAVLALVGGVGIAAQERLLGADRRRGVGLFLAALLAVVLAGILA